MKRTIIIVLAITSSVLLNAASIDWRVASGTLYDGATSPAKITSGSAYLMFVTSSYTQDKLVQAFADAKGNSATTLSAMELLEPFATGEGTIPSLDSRPYGTSTYNLSGDGIAYFVVFNGDKMFVSYTTDVLYDSVSQTGSATFSDSISSFSKTTYDAASGYSNAGWYVVPEPTSGLLMLLGMAGLALKRKRA